MTRYFKIDYTDYIIDDYTDDIIYNRSDDWSYYWDITNDRELVNDLWNGWNFYDIAEVDENLEYLDSIGQCHITSTEELVEYLKDCFGVEEKDIVLIYNYAVNYFKLPKTRVETNYKIGEIIEQFKEKIEKYKKELELIEEKDLEK